MPVFVLVTLFAACGTSQPTAPADAPAVKGAATKPAAPAPGGTLELKLADGTQKTLTLGGAYALLGNQGDGNKNYQLRLFEKTDAPTTCETEAWGGQPAPGGAWAILPTNNTWDGKPGKTEAPTSIISPTGAETYWGATLTITSIADGLLVGELSGSGPDGSATGSFVAKVCQDTRGG